MKLTRRFSKVIYFFLGFFNICSIIDNLTFTKHAFTTVNQQRRELKK